MVFTGSLLCRIGAGDVALQLLDGLLLSGDDPFDEIANGDQADDGVAFQYGKMAEVTLGHEGHAFIDRVLRGDGADGAGHDLADEGVAGVVAFEDALACEVALGEDADQLVVGEDQQRADIVPGQQLDGLVDRLFGCDGENLCLAFSLQFTTIYLPGEENELADALSRANEVNLKVISTNSTDNELLFEAAKRGKILPTLEQQAVMIQRRHLLGHFAVETVTKELWHDGYWWPRMRNDIAKHIGQCQECQRFNIVNEGYYPLQSIEANQPWDHIQIDLIGPVPESTNGFQWILTIVDVMTGFTLLRALKNKSMESVAQTLWNVFADFGIPKILQSDNGPEFDNSLISEMVKLFGLDHRLISAYNPRADGLVERKNKEVKRLLKKFLFNAFGTWELFLPMTQLSLNITTLQRTGSRPFELLFARPFSGFEDFTATAPMDVASSLLIRLENLQTIKEVVWPAVAIRTHEIRSLKQQQHDAHSHIVEPLPLGTRVMVADALKESKWDPPYEGPFTIVKRTRRNNYVLTDATGATLKRKFTIQMLKPIDGVPSEGRNTSASTSNNDSVESLKPAIQLATSANEHFVVTEILAHRKDAKAKAHEYLVHWKGYKDEDNSWVHERDFDDLMIIKKYWRSIATEKRRANAAAAKLDTLTTRKTSKRKTTKVVLKSLDVTAF